MTLLRKLNGALFFVGGVSMCKETAYTCLHR